MAPEAGSEKKFMIYVGKSSLFQIQKPMEKKGITSYLYISKGSSLNREKLNFKTKSEDEKI